jgi:NAD(P)-dependent dehydrogenase (short-subunit alcohol dehydrogenase family)
VTGGPTRASPDSRAIPKPASPATRSILITGTSTGIGRACAVRFASLGFHVFGTVRTPEDARRIAADLGDSVTPLLLDVTDADQIAAVASHVTETVGQRGLIALVNNAGIVAAGPLEYLPVREFRRQLEVNVIGQLAVTQALLPLLRKATGRIVMISSISGRVSLPLAGAYGASKFALEAMSDALRLELRHWNLHVSLIEPGRIDTPIWRTSLARGERVLAEAPPGLEERYGPLINAVRRMATKETGGSPVEEVVRAVEHAVTAPRPRVRYVVGRDAKLRRLLTWLPDRLSDWLIARQLERMRQRR